MLECLVLFITAWFVNQKEDVKSTEDVTPYTVVYSIKDLERGIPNYTNVPEMDINAALNRQGSSFGNVNVQRTQQNDPQVIINLIKSLVETEAWGDTATMTYWNGNIIVKAPKRIHDQIK